MTAELSMITESYIRLILPTLLYFIYYYYFFFFFQRRGDVGPSLVLRPSLRETTSGLPRSCCCNTKSSWSSSGIKSVFIELSILFELSVPPDNSSLMNPGRHILTLLQYCLSRLSGALSYGVLVYSLFLVFLFYGLQLVSKLSRDLVIRCLHFLSTPVQEHPLYLEKITLSISLLLRYRPLMLFVILTLDSISGMNRDFMQTKLILPLGPILVCRN